ncbi:MAG TPA: class II fumarate hydratase [Gammaproteobacteria bacterium]|nr:class II fumarate hydratase [Gammaproteobacteria bacterium]
MGGSDYRIERDSMGELRVPAGALYGAQTQRAVENFPISGLRLPRAMIRALGEIKLAAAQVNQELGSLDRQRAQAIRQAALKVIDGSCDSHFPVDIFQTGSGTSSNMNCNEVIARLAGDASGMDIHPNDHVNMGQSSNDVFPSAIHIAACLTLEERLLPALERLHSTIESRATQLEGVVKTGRTHLMDAMPLTFGQELSGWASQIRHARDRIESSQERLLAIPIGGTAVGTGVNAHPEFGFRVAEYIGKRLGIPLRRMDNCFEGLSSQEAALEMSGQLKTLAAAMMKIANDLRWMSSGPLAGLAEITLPALQPGSSIMPGKFNPVIPEAVAMVCAQVTGNDSAITIGAQSGNFQLNVMLPLIAHNLLQSIELLAAAATTLEAKAIRDFVVNRERVQALLERNPVLVTALNPVIGYEKGAQIAKRAWSEGRPVLEVAREMTDLSEEELRKLLDPAALAKIHR